MNSEECCFSFGCWLALYLEVSHAKLWRDTIKNYVEYKLEEGGIMIKTKLSLKICSTNMIMPTHSCIQV